MTWAGLGTGLGEGEEVVVRAQMRSSDFHSRDSVQKDHLLDVCAGYAQLTGFNILQGKIWECFLEEATSELTFEEIMGWWRRETVKSGRRRR